MSTEQEIVEPTEVDLDTFAAELFGQKEAAPVETNTEVVEDTDEESDAQNEDTHVDAADTSAPDDDDVSEEEEKAEEPPKPKKNRFQERIDEVVGKQREAERKAEELERRLTEALQKLEKNPEPTPKKEEVKGPKATDLNEDGTEKYPLGEFDPTYIRDLMRYTLDEETKIRQENAKKEEEARAREEAQAELQASWNEKLVPAKERYPDFVEKGEQLLGTFEGIDEAYGNYLTTTIMDMEYGPDVFYYLANNVDEAQKIVQSGAKKATIALGRLEAKFAAAEEEKQRARPKVSQAAPPPEHLNKGTSVARPSIRGDEPNLDDFAAAFFKKR